MKYLILAALLPLVTVPALAHSELDRMVPADGAVLSAVPERVSMNFVSDIRLTLVRVIHSDTHSEDLDLGDQSSFATQFAVPLSDFGPGIYQIEWRGLSSDGHAMKGSFSFEVD